ncbi:hypothetical protein H6G97_50000 [Nostoc flagelliforme FACHB-838]|uniref:Uncharacterized protein n=1 Tax=Nostoc flagelliforme FACHB-838 TaxID=2692904 RepID=A0ABR8E5X6_9NOSO|nr:hypothetical protein [Nostoc flagelliforme FACHB-838]
MTYCFAWKYGDTVYLLADTAATKSSLPNFDKSSFGQLHDKVRGEYVEESLLKIVPIAPDTAIAFAGDVQLATAIIEFLKENFCSAETFANLFGKVNASFGPFDPKRPVELLLAYAPSNGDPKLIHWNSKHGLDSNQFDYYTIGSLTSYHAALTPLVLSMLVNGKLASGRILPILIAIVQSYGIHSNIIEQNVGGIIFGLRVCNGKIIWQEDTNFVLYNSTAEKFETFDLISAFVRDNVVVVNSSFTNDIRGFAHSVSTPSIQAWQESWNSFIVSHTNSDKYRYWVFLSTAKKVITVLLRDNFDNENNYFSLQYLGDGNFSFGLSQELMALLMEPLMDRGDGSLPFRLNFRNA